MKFSTLILTIIWLFYTVEAVAGYVLGGDWVGICLVAVIVLPLLLVYQKLKEGNRWQ